MGYRNTSLSTLKYVSHLLDVDEEWLHESSIGMYSEDGCVSVHDEYPVVSRIFRTFDHATAVPLG